MKNFEALKRIINSNADQTSMDAAIDAWEIDINDNFLDELSDRVEELNIENVPYALDSLYRSDNKFKTMVFCVLIEHTCTELPFITNLENYPMFKAKMEFIFPTLIYVFGSCYNGIGDCAAFIILQSDPELTLAKDEDRLNMLYTIDQRLDMISSYIAEKGCKDEDLISTLGITLDLTTYINDEEILDKVGKMRELALDPECELFLMKTLAHNNMSGAEELAKKLVDYDAARVFRILSSVRKEEIIAASGMTQDQIAYSEMKNWLLYPTECGDSLEKLEIADKFVYNDYLYYAFRFTSSNFADRGYMIGVAGGYAKDGLSGNQTGHTFSKFDPIENNCREQAVGIIEMIADYWRKQQEEAEQQ